jgi:hypothetical protein
LRNSEERSKAGENTREAYVRAEWLDTMRTAKVELPGSKAKFSLADLGVSHIVLAKSDPVVFYDMPNPLHPKNRSAGKSDADNKAGGAGKGMNLEMMKDMVGGGRSGTKEKKEAVDDEDAKIKQYYRVRRFDFSVQFVWQPVGLNARLEALEEKAKKRAERAKAQGDQAQQPVEEEPEEDGEAANE